MTVLSQDTARRIIERVAGPPSRNAVAAAAWAQGQNVQWRYIGSDDVWRTMAYAEGSRPNWNNTELEWRPAKVCRYPECNCPFDAPADPTWCARGYPR